MARKKRTFRAGRWLRLFALVVLALAGTAAWYWWDIQHFAPDETVYVEQGVAVGEQQGAVRFGTARALGASFVYLEASAGSKGQDSSFDQNFASSIGADLMVGAIHRFDPCDRADAQTANFVTIVPRDDRLLPPAIALEWTADNCLEDVSDAAVESELMTFINQIEMHSGKPVILRMTDEFEARYGFSSRIDRDLWLLRDRFAPRYAGRPWLLWTANRARRTDIADRPVEWVVVQP